MIHNLCISFSLCLHLPSTFFHFCVVLSPIYGYFALRSIWFHIVYYTSKAFPVFSRRIVFIRWEKPRWWQYMKQFRIFRVRKVFRALKSIINFTLNITRWSSQKLGTPFPIATTNIQRQRNNSNSNKCDGTIRKTKSKTKHKPCNNIVDCRGIKRDADGRYWECLKAIYWAQIENRCVRLGERERARSIVSNAEA